MKRIIDHLISAGFQPGDITPDGKFHRYPSSPDDADLYAWYVCFRNFGSSTGEEFFTIAYGDWAKAIPLKIFSTLVDPSGADRTVIKRRTKEAEKLEVKERNAMIGATSENLARAMLADEPIGDAPPPADLGKMFIHPLGFKEKEYFYTSSHNRQIVAISRFNETDFLNLMPIEYWESVFPGGGAQRVDWTTARSSIMSQARARGIFQSRHVRGAGVWKDEDRIVVNMGDHLIVDGIRVGLGELESRYFYTLGAPLAPLHGDPLDASDCNTLIDTCSTFRWVKPEHSFLMAGALVVSRVCGALPVRPHTWITGGASTGKTTLLEKLIQPILGDSVLYVQGSTTEAGIRQSLRADAIPVVFDEFETTGQKSQENVNSVVELLRAAWSDSQAMVVKGGTGGNAMSFQVRCSAIVSSIRTRLTNDADAQRFAIVELQPHGSDPAHWKRLSSLLSQIDREYGDRLFARTIHMVPILIENYKTLKRSLAGKVSARFGDQYGMLLAGYSILLSDDVLTAEEADSLVENVRLSEEKEDAKVADHDECLGHMLTKKVSLEVGPARTDFSIAEAIREARTDGRVDSALQRIGIKVLSGGVAVASSHNELEAVVYRGTRWSLTWSKSLVRIAGSERGKQVWMSGRNTRSIVLPSQVFGF